MCLMNMVGFSKREEKEDNSLFFQKFNETILSSKYEETLDRTWTRRDQDSDDTMKPHSQIVSMQCDLARMTRQ
jgi:hypothetical protein